MALLPFIWHTSFTYIHGQGHTCRFLNLPASGNRSLGPLNKWPCRLVLGGVGACGGCYWYPSCCARWKILTDAFPPEKHLHIHFPGQTAMVAPGDRMCLSLIGYWLTLLWRRGNKFPPAWWEREVADQLSVGAVIVILSVKYVVALFILYISHFYLWGSDQWCNTQRNDGNTGSILEEVYLHRSMHIWFCLKRLCEPAERGTVYLEWMNNSVWVPKSLHLTWNWFLYKVLYYKHCCILYAYATICMYGVWVGCLVTMQHDDLLSEWIYMKNTTINMSNGLLRMPLKCSQHLYVIGVF